MLILHQRLNLAVASRIYLLEPQWNPSLEQQAFGRAQRLGQTEKVTIIRYIMKDTIEDVSCPKCMVIIIVQTF